MRPGGDDARLAIRLFRRGAAGIVLGVVVMGIVSAVSQDLSMTVESTRVSVPRIRLFSLPALEPSFSMPPMEGEEALTRWMASQIRSGIHDLLVVTYYVGIAVAVGGVALIVSGMVALHRAKS